MGCFQAKISSENIILEKEKELKIGRKNISQIKNVSKLFCLSYFFDKLRHFLI